MGLFSNSSDFFGLDIGTSAIRAVQMRGWKNKVLVRYGSLDIDPKISISDSNADLQKLGVAIKQLITQCGINTTNVAVGLPSNRTFLTVVDIERLSSQELDKTIRLQADSLIPTPLAESKIDWAILGDSPKESTKIEILLGSISNGFVEKRLDLLESIGLNVIAFEPESLALTRSLLSTGSTDAELILDMGSSATDLIITLNDAPRLIRSIPTGTDTLIKSAMQNLGIDEKQAQQFVFKFGMSKDKLEGQILGSISGSIEVLASEIEKSIKFFTARYAGINLSKIIVTGGVSTLPEFPLYLANKFGVGVEIGNSWRNVSFPTSQQDDLLKISNKFSVAAGLA